MVTSLLMAAVGVLFASVLSLVPALHVYNVAGLFFLGTAALDYDMPAEYLAPFLVGMITGYSLLSTVPSIFLSAPDESSVFMVRPGQTYLLQRRGYEAAVLSGIGGLGAVGALALLTPVAPTLLSAIHTILRPHLHWVLWAVIAYLLLSEWPKGSGRAPAGWRRWWDGWKSLTAGLVAFLLSGVLGFILLYRTLVPISVAHQNLLPAFVGLFALPWILQNLLSRVKLPEQYICRTLDLQPGLIVRGTLAGVMGGGFAAFFPVVTGGIGGLLAGHATAQRDDRLFLISQGASKVLYYCGGLLLLFVPRLHLTRGGMAWMLSSRWSSGQSFNLYNPQTYYLAIAALTFSGFLSFFALLLTARVAIRLVSAVDYHWISLGTLIVLLIIVLGVTGWGGLLICFVATGIGLIPVLWGSRQVNCMGVLLLPLALNMVGSGSHIARWLGFV